MDHFKKITSKVHKLIRQSTKEKLPDPVESKPAEKRLVIVGGQVDEELNPKCWELKPREKKFSKLCQIPFPELAIRHSVCPTPGGFVLTGGEKSDLCMLFVVSTKEWREMEKMLKTRCMHASICINNKLYVLCGAVSDTESASVNCLSLTSKSKWEEQRHAPVTACWPKVAELDGKLYMVASESTSRLLEYDIENGQWKKLKPYPEDVNPTSSMITFNGQLCVAGGEKMIRAAGGEKMICAFYNPDTETWSTDQTKPSKSHKFGSLVQQDNTTLLILGGYGTDKIEKFNVAKKCWSTWKVKMPAKLWHHTAMFLNIP